MTILSKLGYKPRQIKSLIPPRKITSSDVSVIIPVKNNPIGINTILSKLNECQTKPSEVIVVDNLSNPSLEIDAIYTFDVNNILCSEVGPAAARNMGASIAKGEWLLFLDSDCIPTETTIAGYLTTSNIHIAYAGNIDVKNSSMLANYYKTQEILIPPAAITETGTRPDYLVTANCLVWKHSFDEVGGFDEKFLQAGGEDIDLAFQLLKIGTIQYQWKSLVQHDFDDGFLGFVSRFIRYGSGNKQIAIKYNLDLTPSVFTPVEPSVVNYLLAFLQFWCLSYGYHKY